MFTLCCIQTHSSYKRVCWLAHFFLFRRHSLSFIHFTAICTISFFSLFLHLIPFNQANCCCLIFHFNSSIWYNIVLLDFPRTTEIEYAMQCIPADHISSSLIPRFVCVCFFAVFAELCICSEIAQTSYPHIILYLFREPKQTTNPTENYLFIHFHLNIESETLIKWIEQDNLAMNQIYTYTWIHRGTMFIVISILFLLFFGCYLLSLEISRSCRKSHIDILTVSYRSVWKLMKLGKTINGIGDIEFQQVKYTFDAIIDLVMLLLAL